MNHKEIRKELAGRIAALLDSKELRVELRQYQHEAFASMQHWLLDPNGTRRGYVAHATGLGKTVLFASLLNFCTELRTLVIVPTKILLEQSARFLYKLTGGMIGHLSSLGAIRNYDGEVIAVHGCENQSIVLTTVASFNRYAAKLAAEHDPQLIIYDECHWAYVNPAQSGFTAFPEAVIIGFSATPDYLTTAAKHGSVSVALENGRMLYAPPERLARTHFGTLLDERSVRWGIENGWLAPLAWGRIKFDVSLEHVPVTDGPAGLDYREADLQCLMAKHWSVTCDTIRRLYTSGEGDLSARQSFAICPSVKAAEELAEAVNSLGIPAACVSGETPDAQRNFILSAYRANEIRFISSVMVLREGWDAPNAEVCLMLRPTKSRVLYLQSMGRVLRPREDGGPKTALVLDAHFQNTRFAPLSAPTLFRAPGETVVDRGILVERKPREGNGAKPPEPSPYLPAGVTPRLVVVDAFEVEHYAGPDGTFEADGDVWGMAEAFAKLFGRPMVKRRIRQGNLCSREGKDFCGRRTDFYPLSKVRALCADLLDDLPRVGKAGTFQDGGETFGTAPAISRLLGISTPTVMSYCKRNSVLLRKGRSWNGALSNFYPLSKVRALCADLLNDLPRVGKAGTFQDGGETFGTVSSLARILGLSEPTIKDRVRGSSISARKGRTQTGQAVNFYPLSKVRELCTDLLDDLPRVGKAGTFQDGGETFGTVSSLARILGLSGPTIQSRIARDGIPYREGMDPLGHRRLCFPLSKVRAACRDVRRWNRKRSKR